MRLSHSRRAAEVGAARRVVRRLLHVPPAMHAVAPVVESLPLPADAAQAAADLSCVASAPASSAASAAMPPLALYWPPDLLLLAVDGIHQTLGLPWWAAIAASTLLARAALLPLAIHGTKLSLRMQSMRAAVDLLQKRLSAGDPRAADELAQLYSQHGVSPSRMLLLPAIQLPLFTSFFFGLRRLADHFPAAHDGGYLWVTDLGTADPTYVLPLATTSSALALVVLSVSPLAAGATQEELQQQRRLRLLLGGATLVGLPIACSMPAAVITFWATNNAFSLAYLGAVRLGPVKDVLGLHAPPRVDLPHRRHDPDVGSGAVARSWQPPPPPSEEAARASLRRAQLHTAASLEAMASTLAEGGKPDEAAALQRRCVALCEEVVGAREPRTLEALRKLAVILERTAQPAEAQDVRVTLAAREGRSSK